MRENSTVEVYMHLADLKRQFLKPDIRKSFILRNMGGEDFFFRHKAVQRGKTVQNRTGTWYEDDERRKLGINIEWKRCQRRRLIKNIWPECERLVERWPAGGQLLPSGPTSTPTNIPIAHTAKSKPIMIWPHTMFWSIFFTYFMLTTNRR